MSHLILGVRAGGCLCLETKGNSTRRAAIEPSTKPALLSASPLPCCPKVPSHLSGETDGIVGRCRHEARGRAGDGLSRTSEARLTRAVRQPHAGPRRAGAQEVAGHE